MFGGKSTFITWLFTVFMVSSTSSVLREAPISKGKTVKILRCGDEIEFSRNTKSKSDYGRWVNVKLKSNSKITGWIPKSVLTQNAPVCPLSHIPLDAINPSKLTHTETAIKDELIEANE